MSEHTQGVSAEMHEMLPLSIGDLSEELQAHSKTLS